MNVIALEHVTKRYRDGHRQIDVLDDVCLEIYEGEWLGVWGPRRSGKSTLLQVAAGRLRPDEGKAYFNGSEISRMSTDALARLQRRGGVGLLSGDWRPIRTQPVIEYAALPLLSDGLSLREAREPAWRALERAGVASCAYMPAERLSARERVRVSLARVLVHRPRVIMLDEPAALLRPSEAAELYELLRSLGRESPVSIVIASEELAAIRKADRIVSIDDGQLREMQTPGTLVQFPDPPRRRP
jgi:putative ABC transport system ATP-binding protein